MPSAPGDPEDESWLVLLMTIIPLDPSTRFATTTASLEAGSTPRSEVRPLPSHLLSFGPFPLTRFIGCISALVALSPLPLMFLSNLVAESGLNDQRECRPVRPLGEPQ